jgi:ankyrin repeat protein
MSHHGHRWKETSVLYSKGDKRYRALVDALGDGKDQASGEVLPVWTAATGPPGSTAQEITRLIGVYGGGGVNECSTLASCTALYVASVRGDSDAINCLLEAGADVDKPDDDGTPPAWVAAQSGHADALHVLLKKGAVIDDVVYDGFTALQMAARAGHTAVVRVLAEIWPLDRRPWKMFLMGGGVASELQDYLAPPANHTTRNFLPRLYSKPDVMKVVWMYLHKPRYVDLERDAQRSAASIQRSALDWAIKEEHGAIEQILYDQNPDYRKNHGGAWGNGS